MRRREFITLWGGAAATWPLVARAQQSTVPLIGFLHGAAPGSNPHLEAAFRNGLAELGYAEGRNAAIEFHWVAGRYETMPVIAGDLARRAAVIVVGGGGAPLVIGSKTTGNTPIVFNVGTDPVRTGLVASINRPGGSATGVYIFTTDLEPKRLEFLRDLVPGASSAAVLFNPNFSSGTNSLAGIEAAGRTLGFQIAGLRASTPAEIETAFTALAQQRPSGLLVAADPFFNGQRNNIVARAARLAIPAIFEQREFVVAGGLASYGTSLRDAYVQIGRYTGRILKGERPGDLPIVQSTKFELVINLKTAKALGLNLSQNLVTAADEVIE